MADPLCPPVSPGERDELGTAYTAWPKECSASGDGLHCPHWWDSPMGACHWCGAGPGKSSRPRRRWSAAKRAAAFNLSCAALTLTAELIGTWAPRAGFALAAVSTLFYGAAGLVAFRAEANRG